MKSFIISDTEELVFCMIQELGNTYAVSLVRQQNITKTRPCNIHRFLKL